MPAHPRVTAAEAHLLAERAGRKTVRAPVADAPTNVAPTTIAPARVSADDGRRASSLRHAQRIADTPSNPSRKRGVNASSRTITNPGNKKARRIRQRRRR